MLTIYFWCYEFFSLKCYDRLLLGRFRVFSFKLAPGNSGCIRPTGDSSIAAGTCIDINTACCCIIIRIAAVFHFFSVRVSHSLRIWTFVSCLGTGRPIKVVRHACDVVMQAF